MDVALSLKTTSPNLWVKFFKYTYEKHFFWIIFIFEPGEYPINGPNGDHP